MGCSSGVFDNHSIWTYSQWHAHIQNRKEAVWSVCVCVCVCGGGGGSSNNSSGHKQLLGKVPTYEHACISDIINNCTHANTT